MTKKRVSVLSEFLVLAGIAFVGIGLKDGDPELAKRYAKSIIQDTALQPFVEAEEVVYGYTPANNGADPMWCSGSTCITRIGNRVFASGLETIAGLNPMSNCRWTLFERNENGWRQILVDKERTREPCPLATFNDGRLFLSINSTLNDPKEEYGPARPEILVFNTSEDQLKHELLPPIWTDITPFTVHSYRSLVTDGVTNELLLFNNVGIARPENDFFTMWSFYDMTGKWSAKGELKWPWGSEYEVPQPIRVCYPTVMMKGRSVFFCGVSDIIEPKKAWREYKREITGKEWDYDFRRLFFTWSDDITVGQFHPWIEIASREATCGRIFPADLWVGPDGAVHLLWTERAIDERLREKFFPDAKQSHALNYAIIRNGKVDEHRTLAIAEEGISNEKPGSARFQVTPENRLFVVFFVSGTNISGQEVAENRLLELTADGVMGIPVTIPLKKPFRSFFTANVRSGSKPSKILDMLGKVEGDHDTIHYAKIRLW